VVLPVDTAHIHTHTQTPAFCSTKVLKKGFTFLDLSLFIKNFTSFSSFLCFINIQAHQQGLDILTSDIVEVFAPLTFTKRF